MKRMLLSLLGMAALAYGAMALLLWVVQDRLVYFPLTEIAVTPRAYGFNFEEVTLNTEDGLRLHAWFVPAPRARASVLFLHGNGGNISHRLEKIAILRALGLDVFIVDYRGYGRSQGRPSEEGTYRDARAAWDYLTTTRVVAATRIVVYGESLGAAVAAHLAAQHAPRALIVESGFTSLPDLGSEIYPWLPVRRLSRFHYDGRAALARVHAPVLVIHSRADEIVPFRHGERLFAVANEPKRLLEIDGGHNDGFLLSRDRYADGIDAFLRQLPAR